jgi:uncharacterized membrane-anchored protein
MQQYHVPLLGLRYWIALCLASIFGANMGDFFAHNLEVACQIPCRVNAA